MYLLLYTVSLRSGILINFLCTKESKKKKNAEKETEFCFKKKDLQSFQSGFPLKRRKKFKARKNFHYRKKQKKKSELIWQLKKKEWKSWEKKNIFCTLLFHNDFFCCSSYILVMTQQHNVRQLKIWKTKCWWPTTTTTTITVICTIIYGPSKYPALNPNPTTTTHPHLLTEKSFFSFSSSDYVFFHVFFFSCKI